MTVVHVRTALPLGLLPDRRLRYHSLSTYNEQLLQTSEGRYLAPEVLIPSMIKVYHRLSENAIWNIAQTFKSKIVQPDELCETRRAHEQP